MDWRMWVERIFERIAERWAENEEWQRVGVPFVVEMLIPELAALYPHDDLFDALVEAHVDLEWLGVVENAEVDDPPRILLTPLGQRAIAAGLWTVTTPRTEEKCARLAPDHRRFLVALVNAARRDGPTGVPPRYTWFRVEQIAREAFSDREITETLILMAIDVAWDLWSDGFAVRDAERSDDSSAPPVMIVTPLSAGFACVAMQDDTL